MRFTKIPESTFKNLQMNAGVVLSTFNTEGMSAEDIQKALIGATSGGVNFTATPTYSDIGEDIDNCPVNVKELKHLDSWEISMSGTFVTVTAEGTRRLIGAADVSEEKVTPRNDLNIDKDFEDLWWVGDYSDANDEGTGGYVAVHMMNTLSTGGLQIQSGNREKGTFDFEFTAHYTLEDQTVVPFEVYVHSGSEASPTSLKAEPEKAADEEEKG